MTLQSLTLLAVFLLILFPVAWIVGYWIFLVADKRYPELAVERILYRLAGVDLAESMSWQRYASALLIFNLLGILAVFALQRLQGYLPLNPQDFPAVSVDSAFNTAVSFVTNTNWQGYGGETTMSYLVQMLALTVQNFLSAATGIAVVLALIRGLVARSATVIGNFWVDLTRITLYVLLPLSLIFAIFLISQGVIQNFSAYQVVHTLEPVTYQQMNANNEPETVTTSTQTIAMGPVASQEAIKMIGTNGGGFFNANSAHPYENPTPLTNLLQMLSIFLIPAGLCFAFGRMVGDERQGWTILGAMTVIFIIMTLVVFWAEQQPNPLLSSLNIDQSQSAWQSGGNMEGKEVRFGISASALFAAITTAASCGAVNAMHDSFMPLGGLIPLWLIQLGEVVFGGVGSGLYGMLVFAMLAVFIAGLMVGRTPEYLGKKIESYEMKMISLVILITPFLVLGGTAIAVVTEVGKAGISNPGAHGFSQVLYAFSSAANNNGSAFAGLSANTLFYNILLAIAMVLGRFAVIVPILAIAGSLAAKKKLEVTSGTLPTHGILFMILLVGTVMLVGALTYIPALALGPIVEHLQLVNVQP
jgi:K+-transporting ATPase ATPase A chain